ncbi:MAG: DNA repair protein RadC [Spirochaetes bacterium]|uniref:DNA repair protein RadC n=1 Tax=Candidatus Ornithospirochaeta stercoripullorum TaxID=2840899 RepID=A0A9D9DZJ7_9SPIO|nr:DNA repair protein RadC [Candidatus Ornithospirochaeta stercoripullorum]
MSNYIIRTAYSTMKETPIEDRPREKMERLGPAALTDEELLMLIIGSGNAKRPVNEIAEELLEKIDRNPSIRTEEIMLIQGIGKAKASAIDAALELGRRRVRGKGRTISAPADIFNEIRHYASRQQEHLLVIMLNGAHEVMGNVVATVGLLNRTIVHPREVFSEPLKQRVAAIAIAHNHPSGNVLPSEDDKDVTQRLKKCGDILGIKILDHIVFSDDKYYSFLEHGIL